MSIANLNHARSTKLDQSSQVALDEKTSLAGPVTLFSCLIFDLKRVNNERLTQPPEEWEGLESYLIC